MKFESAFLDSGSPFEPDGYFHTDSLKGKKTFPIEVIGFIQKYGGRSCSAGLFRTHTLASAHHWLNLIEEYFPQVRGAFYPFGFDWMGRHFGIGTNALQDKIIMVDPATGEYFSNKQSIFGFLEEDLGNEIRPELFAEDYFQELIKSIGRDLAPTECFAFKTPLCLGGKDEIQNYEIADMEVSWDFNIQLIIQVNKLPPGTPISGISIK